jgi:hypothetical protein
MATLRKRRVRGIARWPFASARDASWSCGPPEAPRRRSGFMNAVVHTAVVGLLGVASTATLWGAGQTSFLLAPTWVYDFFDVVGPDGGSFEITGFNNHYDIIGVGVSGAVLLSGGVAIPLAVPGALYTTPHDINDDATVVGFFQVEDAFNPNHAFRYSGGTFSTLPFPAFPSANTAAHGIDNHGRIVGSYSYFDFFGGATHQYGFDTSSTGGVNLLEGFNFFDVNDAGHVVGAAYPTGERASFIVGPDVARVIAHPGAVQTDPDAVNNLDSVVGVYYGGIDTSKRRGFVWTNGKSVGIDYPGSEETWLTGINDAGVISGNYRSPSSGGAFFAVPRSPVNVSVNGSDGPLTLNRTAALRVDVAFKAPPAGQLESAEVYIGVVTPTGLLWLDPISGVFVTTPTRAFAGALPNFGPVAVINLPIASAVAPGAYTWFLLVDDDVNSVPNGVFYDFVQVTIR